MKNFLIAACAVVSFAMPAAAATLSGTFHVDIYQRLNANANESKATPANLAASQRLGSITYNGELDFETRRGSSTKIGQWLESGMNGSFTTLPQSVLGLQLSKPNIRRGTATTTFFVFSAIFNQGFNSVIQHDDGIRLFDDGQVIANSARPTTVKTTVANGFDGGEWRLIYAATNSDPSVLKVTGNNLPSPVPAPAAGLLLLSGLGAFAALRRRKKA